MVQLLFKKSHPVIIRREILYLPFKEPINKEISIHYYDANELNVFDIS